MVTPTYVGLTVAYGLGFAAVCLRCPHPVRLAAIVAYRSDALLLLEEHDRQAHPVALLEGVPA